VEIPRFISKPDVRQVAPGVWSIDDKLQMHLVDAVGGEAVGDGINGCVRRSFSARAGEVFLDAACVYQPMVPGRKTREVVKGASGLKVGGWTIRREADGTIGVSIDRSY
jgi:hypothetical protein